MRKSLWTVFMHTEQKAEYPINQPKCTCLLILSKTYYAPLLKVKASQGNIKVQNVV